MINSIKPVYSGHLVITDTFSWNRPNHGQTLLENSYIEDYFTANNYYSGHNFLTPREKFKPNLSPYSVENKSKVLFDFQMFLFDTPILLLRLESF